MTAAGPGPVHERVFVQGLACHELRLPQGDRVWVAEHGGHVLSWVSGGRERLYLSDNAVLDGKAAIRGGIPVCWPQFSDRGTLPRHGWVRQSQWQCLRVDLFAIEPSLTLGIRPGEAPRAPQTGWSYECHLELKVLLEPGALTVTLSVFNEGASALPFTGALHTYLALDDTAWSTVSGWVGSDTAVGWDSARGGPCQVLPSFALRGEVDLVLPQASGPLTVAEGERRLLVNQSGWADTVVWNPGSEKCAALADMRPGDEQRMACVEAAQAFAPVVVAPGAIWSGWQRLQVLSSS